MESVSVIVKTQIFDNIYRAIGSKSFEPLIHDVQNVLLFIPLGFFIPLLNKKLGVKWALICGFMLSTIIENIQLLFFLGECDINDIVSNTLGTVMGYLLCKISSGEKRFE